MNFSIVNFLSVQNEENIPVKVAVSRDFRPQFFCHKSNPSGPPINKLNWFCLEIRFCEDIRIRSSKNSIRRSVTV